MPKSIFLPTDEDCTIEIVLGDKTIEADVFELDDMIGASLDKAKEYGSHWYNEFPLSFKERYGVEIKPGHAVLLYSSIEESIRELKKNLTKGSEASTS